ncbi:DUF1430 domain-containing protein [Enterococcus faecium]|uniref:DUF1430 domain-containing protein n=1 Tax=Enterococcus faecium TaxID=1352 RepID=A0A7V7GNP0_ENTFC|nr:DUF1430 domain-containing protein [Enterococcus faecium]KAA0690739.1 DUF1430 domain-containing protein [Enterococcus faecium]MBK5027502.1 DUF1430 domain-containing protein [Enterococcus faecium]MBK5037463.1 DUF1430 domain-containing protein [Enterococcus faecium]MBK5043001.1 DUF1430 domain-containing protein [Enterococcus faecium]MBK5067393.1 DUF1430 domain-containing protein [Enterococcus faecium]
MKKIYRFFFLFTVTSFLYAISFAGTEMIKSAIPEIHSSIIIEAASGEENQQEMYQTIAKYAREKQLDLHKILFRIGKDGETYKDIYTFGKEGYSTYSFSPIASDYPINFYDSSKLSTEEVLGGYMITEEPPANMIEEFYDMGMEITIERAQWPLYLASGLLLSIGQLFCMLFLCLFLALLFYKSSMRKKVGILETLGRNKAKLVCKDSLIDAVIFTVILAGFAWFYPYLHFLYPQILLWGIIGIIIMHISSGWVIYSWGSIADKIKGHKPYRWLSYTNHLIKATLLVFIVVSGNIILSSMDENKQLEQQLAYWNDIPDYYHLRFSNITTKLPDNSRNFTREERKKEAKRINQDMLPLLERAEQSGGILLRDNAFDHTSDVLTYIQNDAYWLVNHNAVHELKVKDIHGKPIYPLEDAFFYVLIPENKKQYTDLIVKMAEDEITFYQNSFEYEQDEYQGELKVIYTQSNQIIFNYNFDLLDNIFSFNPIIVSVSLPLIQPNIEIWISEVSNGSYLFRNGREVQVFIEENGIEDDFYGLTSVKDRISEVIAKARSEFYTALVVFLLILISFVAIELYASMIYTEVNKKKSFLAYITGKPLFQRHKTYYYMTAGISSGVLGILLIWQKDLWPIALAVFSFELFLLLPTTYLSEKKQRLEVIKND